MAVRLASLATKGNLLKHYILQHVTTGCGQSQPCLYCGYPCTFNTQSALRTHLSRYHAAKESLQANIISTFKCSVCDASCSTRKEFFPHIGNHLKDHETVFCVFQGCSFQTNIYNTFLKHKSRRHQPYSLSDFKQAVYERHYSRQPTSLIYQRPVLMRELVQIVIPNVHHT